MYAVHCDVRGQTQRFSITISTMLVCTRSRISHMRFFVEWKPSSTAWNFIFIEPLRSSDKYGCIGRTYYGYHVTTQVSGMQPTPVSPVVREE